jgi:hypothetical protein
MQNEGARIQNRLELVYYRFVPLSSAEVIYSIYNVLRFSSDSSPTNKNTKTAEPYFLREGKSGSLSGYIYRLCQWNVIRSEDVLFFLIFANTVIECKLA